MTSPQIFALPACTCLHPISYGLLDRSEQRELLLPAPDLAQVDRLLEQCLQENSTALDQPLPLPSRTVPGRAEQGGKYVCATDSRTRQVGCSGCA